MAKAFLYVLNPDHRAKAAVYNSIALTNDAVTCRGFAPLIQQD